LALSAFCRPPAASPRSRGRRKDTAFLQPRTARPAGVGGRNLCPGDCWDGDCSAGWELCGCGFTNGDEDAADAVGSVDEEIGGEYNRHKYNSKIYLRNVDFI
jgi:hypothetical protein